jgi:hypothetical protein
VIAQGGASLQALFSAGYTATALGRTAWKGLIGPTGSLQANCNQEGFDSAPAGLGWPRTRIGIVSNQENDCGSPDSRIGIGGAGGTCSDNASITTGDVAAGCSPDNGDVNIAGFGYVFVR